MKRPFYKCFFAAFLICIDMLGKVQERWIPFDSLTDKREPTIEVVNSDNTEHYIKITFHGMYAEDVEQEGTTYRKLSFGSMYAAIGAVGEPAMPVVSQLIALPLGDDCACSIIKNDSVDLSIGAIYPFLEPVTEDEREVFVKNDKAYSSILYDSPVLTKGTPQVYRGIRNVRVGVCPFKYYPQKGRLTVYRSVYVRIVFESAEGNRVLAPARARMFPKGIFDNNLEQIQSNQNAAPQKTAQGCHDYLIIVGDDSTLYNSAALKKFYTWKSYKGHKVKVVSTTETGSSCESIKNYIKGEYANAGIKYVLFVGKDDRIPEYEWTNFRNECKEGDYWYGCMDDTDDTPDVQADIAIGRFPTNKLEELQNMICKSIAYESTKNINVKKVLLVAHKQDAPERYQGCMDTIFNTNYSTPMTFIKAYGADMSKGGTKATNDTLIKYINRGLNILNYRGHGNETKWPYSWSFDNKEFATDKVDSLTNTAYPIVFSIACLNSHFGFEPCLMEKFMDSPKGAAFFLGATESTFTSTNSIYNKKLYGKLLDENIFNIGDLNIAAHISTIASVEDPVNTYLFVRAISNAFCYVCAGDPSLEIFTQPAKTFDVVTAVRYSRDVRINAGPVNGFSVSVVSVDGELLDTVSTDITVITLQDVPYDAHIVLNKRGYIPYEVKLSTAYVQNESFMSEQAVVGENIEVGENVTTFVTSGSVMVNSGASLKLKSASTTLIRNGFECKKGGELIIE